MRTNVPEAPHFKLLLDNEYVFVTQAGQRRGEFLGYLWMPEGSPAWIVADMDAEDDKGGRVECLNPAYLLAIIPLGTDERHSSG